MPAAGDVQTSVDLSIWPVGVKENNQGSEMAAILESGKKFLICDDSDAVSGHAVAAPSSPRRFDIIVDNAGFELFCDLCLADVLVSTEVASVVHIHLKRHPTFVSDAMAKDVANTIQFVGRNDSPAPTLALSRRWALHIVNGRWLLREDFFWAQPSPMWEMPDRLATDLAKSHLVIVKGDANYRRLLGDCEWPLDTPFADIMSYFPAPVCALRTLKAELGCGMEKTKTAKAASEHADWLVSGQYGVVQFLDTR